MASKTASKLFIAVVTIGVMYILQGVLVPLLFAILTSIVLYPLTARLEKLKIPRALASIISVVFSIVVLAGLIWFIVNQVIVIGKVDYQFQEKYTQAINALEKFFLNQFGLEPTDMWDWLKKESQNMISSATSYLTSFFGSAGSTLANFVLMPLYIYFILYFRDFFVEFFYRAFDHIESDKVHRVLVRIYYVIQSYIVGLVTVMAIVAVLNTLGLLILGIEYAWFFGILAALLLLIPYIGIAIGSILPALFALATMDNGWYALGVIIWFQIVQFFEGNFITPNIVGGKVSINPMAAIISLLLGGMLFGLMGLILALPLVAVIKVVFDASEDWQAIGFVLGEPSDHHLSKVRKSKRRRKWTIPGIYRNREK
ncbi:AI-2E family transporter [Membranihabitans maritimus]|uniref:AI-2E family transporter n=1 Tax=Membranihabitans maritimus TaxID=2904244 RepID=UPI001F37BDED|nr:AI-2E family transporter [Membranihabitans maritimus]